MQPPSTSNSQLDLPPINTTALENGGKYNRVWAKWLNNLWMAVIGSVKKVNPSIVDNFVSFDDTVGAIKDSGCNSSTFALYANGVTNGNNHSHSYGDGAQINHIGLSNIGTNSHTQIDSHISSVANPHQVTYSQTGAEPANANIQAHIASTSNPHNVTKTQVGLSNVPNTDCTNATNISSGTLDDARLSSNVALKNINNNFASSQNVTGDAVATGKVQGATGRFGGDTNYSEFESDGTYKANGDATTWDDLNGSVLEVQVIGTGLSLNASESTLEYTTLSNLLDYAYDNYQIRHAWKAGSVVHPHIHWEQAQNNIPNFLMRYRWQINGGTKTTIWSDYKCNTTVFTYSSGTLNQICKGAGITPPANYNISDVLEIRVFRDSANTSAVFSGADPYTATVGVTFIDIHIESDTLGSRTEYSK